MTRGKEGGNDQRSAPLFTQGEPGSSACSQAILDPALVKRENLLHHETSCETVFSGHHVQSTLPAKEVNGHATPSLLLDQSTMHIPHPDS